MDIEDLTKSQLILLTVLVNFVTSVATGILTVSLLDEAPPIVTQTIDRVVEHTVETVTQAAPAAVIQAPQPSVEELITSAFAALEAHRVSFYDPGVGTTTPITEGTLLSRSRVAVGIKVTGLAEKVIVGFADGTFANATRTHSDDVVVIYSFSEDTKLPAVSALTLIASKDLRVGQTALALTADGSAATGIVAKVTNSGVFTSLPKAPLGSSAVDLGGNVIGISGGSESGFFVSPDRIRDLLLATSTASAAVESSAVPSS